MSYTKISALVTDIAQRNHWEISELTYLGRPCYTTLGFSFTDRSFHKGIHHETVPLRSLGADLLLGRNVLHCAIRNGSKKNLRGCSLVYPIP